LKLLLTILLFLSLSATGQHLNLNFNSDYAKFNSNEKQNKWYEPTRNEIISIPLMALSGYYKATREAINYRGFGKGDKFLDINTSWKNKYKNWPEDKSERFPGSKTIFVMFTDGNHLFGAANTITLTAGSYFVLSDIKDEWKKYKGWEKVGYIIVRKLGPYLIRSIIFEHVYKTL